MPSHTISKDNNDVEYPIADNIRSQRAHRESPRLRGMQLTGPGVFGPPKDRANAVAVLREAVERGVNHIDTRDSYGPHITNQIIAEALRPYPEHLVIVTKVGAKRGFLGSVHSAMSREDITESRPRCWKRNA
jgi:pyridoxine 4-dehydrogenase